MNNKRHPYSLVGIDGNAFSIISYTINAMKQCGYSKEAIQCYREEALSDNYDNLLSISIMMVDNCNKLSGYDDPMQQMMKGHDDLDYVDSPYSGTQNRTEKLIDENYHINENIDWSELDDDDPPLTDTFKNRDEQDKPVKLTNDYEKLYDVIFKTIERILSNQIADKNMFTKAMVKNALIGSDSFINDTCFWEDLEDQIEREIPNYLYEGVDPGTYLKHKIESNIYNALVWLLEEGVKFSKYDVYHVFTELVISNKLYNQLDIYIPEGD